VSGLAACGGSPQNANAPSGKYTVQVPVSTFPASQRLTQQSHLRIVVRNPGPNAIPDPAVTICNVTCWPLPGQHYPLPAGMGTSVMPFAVLQKTPYSASLSKQVWIVDRNPNPIPCITGAKGNKSYSCASGGPGGMVTADANTWALGHPLKPGRTVTFDWAVTAVCTGRFTVAWEVSGDVYGNAKAVLADGSKPRGRFTVTISGTPDQSYVDNGHRIVTTGGAAPAPNGQNPVTPTTVPCNA
jgi:hypothetical protein